MPGFGRSRFGQEQAGRWKWSRQVLFDFLPEIYREADKVIEGIPLETYTEALRPSFDTILDRIRALSDQRDPVKVRTEFDEVEILRLGAEVPTLGEVEQSGLDGKVQLGAAIEFVARSARFRSEDLGKQLTLLDSSIARNNRPVVVASIISPTTVTTFPELSVTPVGEIVRWQLREVRSAESEFKVEVQSGDVSRIGPGWILRDGTGIFTVKSRRQFNVLSRENQILTEKEGADAFVDSDGFIHAPTALLEQKDVGKKITLSASSIAENNGKVEIQHVFEEGGESIAIPSFLTIQGPSANGGVSYSSRGADINDEPLRIRHVDGGLSASLSVQVTKGDVTVTPATNAFGEVTSTASDVAAAIAADATATLLLRAQPEGTGTGVVGIQAFAEVTGRLLDPDSGLLNWAVLPRPELTLLGRTVPKGLVEQDGVDLEVLSSGPESTVKMDGAALSDIDIGKRLTVRGSAIGNDGFFPVTAIENPSTCRVTGILLPETDLFWELRSNTEEGDKTQVRAHAQSLIPFLARDFDIEIDELQKESRQRSNVQDVFKWADIKGHPDSYNILALIQGFGAEVEQMYSVNQDFFVGLDPSVQFRVGSGDLGRSGSDGQLIAGTGGRVRFASPTAAFVPEDVGKSMSFTNLTSPTLPIGHNGLFSVETFVDTNTLEFRLADSFLFDLGTLPSNDDINWDIFDLFTTQAPLFTTFDVFNTDALKTYIDNTPPPGDDIRVDQFCSEPTWSSTMQTEVTVVDTPSLNTHVVTVNLTGSSGAPPRSNADIAKIIVGLGIWKFIDNNDIEFFLETVPEPVLGDPTKAIFEVGGAFAPQTGAGTIELICTPRFDFECDYCATSVLLARISGDTILSETGRSLQNVFRRLFERLEETTPHHVRLVTSISITLEATLNLQASGLSNVVVPGPSLPIVMSGTGTVSPLATGYAIGPKVLGTGTVTLTGVTVS